MYIRRLFLFSGSLVLLSNTTSVGFLLGLVWLWGFLVCATWKHYLPHIKGLNPFFFINTAFRSFYHLLCKWPQLPLLQTYSYSWKGAYTVQHQKWWSKSGYGHCPSYRAGAALLPLSSLFVRKVATAAASGRWVTKH